MNRYDLQGRAVVITGGGGGIGRAIARVMLTCGARVSLWDKSDAALREAEASLEPGGFDRIVRRVVDVTREDEVTEALAADVAAHDGRIEGFVNNAGIHGEVAP